MTIKSDWTFLCCECVEQGCLLAKEISQCPIDQLFGPGFAQGLGRRHGLGYGGMVRDAHFQKLIKADQQQTVHILVLLAQGFFE